MLKVKDVMVTNVVTVDVDVSIRKAVERMNAQVIGCLIVLEKGHYAGILTERDVLARVVAKALNPENVLVGQVMSVKLMLEKQIKKLPVISNEKLVGLITMTDIASTHPEMVKFIKEISAKYDVPKRIKKVIEYYIM